jgi:hypothetical protein
LAFDFVVKEITRLSQDEGFNDREIADMLGCSRATVNRVRVSTEIPKANLNNKKDKTYVCSSCGVTVSIRRNERRKLYCDTCMREKSN